MKASPAAAAAAAAGPGQAGGPREPDARWREKGEAEAERQRTRERLEATLAGLGELEYLRQRQELLVKSLLLRRPAGAGPGAQGGRGEPPGEGPPPRSLEEKFLEENILLLRRQLNCLRRRDAGLLNQLQELDKQISDLRLDVEKTTDEHLETDSRPSSGFYELSDGASGSLSNSSNSVFSECLSSCHSSTCFCSPLEATLNISDGRPKSADVHPKYQCDLVSKNGNDVYRYPSPLHAVAVQSPMFLLPVTENPQREEERLGCDVSDVCAGSETDSGKSTNTFVPQSSWLAPCPSTSKRIDSYILSLVQKKTHAVRTNKPRTSLNADPTKGILRHGSMCVRQPAGVVAHGNVVNLKSSKQACLPSGGTTALDHAAPSPLKQRPREPASEQLESRKAPLPAAFPPATTSELQSKHLSRGVKPAPPELSRNAVAAAGDVPKENGQLFAASPKESPGKPVVLQPENHRVSQPPKKVLLKSSLQAARSSSPAVEERPALDFKSEGSSSQSLDDGLLVNAQYIPAQQQSMKLHKGTRNVKILKSSVLKHRPHLANGLENSVQTLREKTKPVGKKCRFPDELDTNKKLKKPSSRGKRGSSLQQESGIPSRQAGLHKSAIRSHGHGREVVVAKPKHKRADYRRWKSSAEISYEEALRRARRNRREGVGVYSQVPLPYVSPYAYVASDSEYSAECESLFHSTVVDTSEDEQSNYTTNCFGDSESSLSEVEFVGESTTTSDSDESGGLIWSQFVQTLPIQTVTAPELHENAAKAFVKIKASHNLKKKILRFRSGSLKLMTTV
ncbi:dapper homolog 1 isoform X3 [Falco biarmicus]|uniref:dapper homolog 1 isoform X3 n=1 Tax=Falco cherrug TaxID=345164 RepID=UPI00247998B2|nr:dapper homolog 1 isoform X3 [Falco cherrug]XP_056203212.1 dapper homolog 1 isoform X3 [Falco biarmicus]